MKKVQFILAALMAAALLALAGCGASADQAGAGGEKITVKTAKGDVEIPKNPKRVAMLDLSVADTLDVLGIEPEAVGVPKALMPAYLDKYRDGKYTDLGDIKNPDFETISKFAPDVIFINGRQQASYDELVKIAPVVYLTNDPENFLSSFEEHERTIARIFDREKEVEPRLQEISDEIAKLKGEAKQRDLTGLIMMTTGGKMHAFGPGSRQGLLFNALDLKTAVHETEGGSSSHGETISYEFIAQANPDYIFVIDRDTAIGEGSKSISKDLLDNALVNTTKAAQNGKIVFVDGGLWYIVGDGLGGVKRKLADVRTALDVE